MPVNKQKTQLEITGKDKTGRAIKSAEAGMKKLDNIAGKLALTFGGLAGLGGIGLLIQKQAEGARRAIAYADALGVSTEALTSWQHAGQEVGLEADKIADIFKDTAEKIGDAFRNDAGEAKEALESLNLSIKDMAQLSPDQQLLAIAGALDQVGTQGEKVQILESLANDATLLLPLLDDNASKLKDLIKQADDTGVTLTRIEADKLQEAATATREIDAAFEGLSQTLAVNLAGPLVESIKLINQTITKMGTLGKQAADLFTDTLIGDSGITGVLEQEEEKLQRLETKYKMVRGKAKSAALEQVEAQKLVVEQARATDAELRKRAKEFREGFKAPVIDIPQASTPGVGGKDDDKEAKKKIQDDLDRLRVSLYSEEEAIHQSFLARQAIIDTARENNIGDEQERLDLLFEINSEHEDKLSALLLKGLNEREKFQRLSAKNQTKTVLGELTTLTAGIAQHSRKAFELNKAVGIANAIIGAHEGASKSLSAYPWPLAGVMAGLHYAAGLAQVNAIRSASFNGGGAGSAPSLSGSTPATPVTPIPQQEPVRQQQGSQITIHVEGSVYANDDFRRAMVEAIQDAQSNDEIRILNNG